MSTTPPPKKTPFSSPPPEAWLPLVRIAQLASRPFDRFLRIEAASGILLLIAAAIALLWANSPWSEAYFRLWNTPLGLRVGGFTFERSLEWFVNDALMALFFFVVGMEIRHEIKEGELSEWRRAALPAAAALGGMIVPAAFYLLFANDANTRSGWGVPMATDIAFAVGILTLLGKRVPGTLRILLLTLAVIDDLGAIVVIALFYSSGIVPDGLLIAALGFIGVFALQRVGVRSKFAYMVPSTIAWAGIYMAGVHPTIAGVLVGLATPVRAWLGPEGFVHKVRTELDQLAETLPCRPSTHELSESLRYISTARREAMSPAQSLIEMLHPWVAFGIMPVFALANAGVVISIDSLDTNSWWVIAAVSTGLIVGKPIGVLLASWITLRLGIGRLPAGVGFRHLAILGMVAGVGFTMSIFIAQLAFEDAQLLVAAKLGVLVASVGAALLGLLLGRWILRPIEAPLAVSEETHSGELS